MVVRSRTGKKFLQGLFVGLAGTTLAVFFWALGWLELWELKSYDWRASVLARPGKATDDIVVVVVDQSSLDWGKEVNGLAWPWPRQVYAPIIEYCQRSGAKAIAFDMIFTEHSRYGVEDDDLFGRAISAFENFSGAISLSEVDGGTTWPKDLTLQEFKIVGLRQWLARIDKKGIVFPKATIPIPEVTNNSKLLCNVTQNPDADDADTVYRRVKLFAVFDNKTLPTLGLGAYLAAETGSNAKIELGKILINDRTIPIDRNGNAILRFRGAAGTHKRYTAAQVLQSEIRITNGETPTIRDPNAFKDKFVFFGVTAPGLYDLKSTPVGGAYPGVELHATLLDNFLSNDFIRHTPRSVTFLFILVLAISCALLITFFSGPLKGLGIGCGAVATPIAFSLAAYHKGFWLLLVIPEAAVLVSVILALAANFATEGRQKRFIKNAFRQYLSPAVIEQLIQHPERLELGGERRVLSIFFSDLEGFTSISEGLEPEKLTALLNEYLTAMTEIVHDEGGTVDKYEGDAIIAFWNAPLPVQEHAVKSVRAALRCQAELKRLRPSFKERINKDMRMRIGINTGPAVVGNLGSKTRFDYTMLGDAVNLAARLEGINKQFFNYTIISQPTREMIGERFGVREMGRVTVVGRKEPVTIYEPMLPEVYQDRKEILEQFDRGLELFYQGKFDQAIDIFNVIQNDDPPAKAYVEKCRLMQKSDTHDWRGIWVVTTK